ncbi:MAG: ornithine cyclodeaminase family protein [Desulfobacter sp.]
METITENRIEELLPMSRAIEVVEQAFRDCARGMIATGRRGTLEIDGSGGSCILLPARHKESGFYSVKYAASIPACSAQGLPTVQSVIWLFSARTGRACAMIEANALTAVKTGAASAVATRHLSNEHAGILTVIGAGDQARTQIAGISQVRILTEIRLVDLDPDRSQALKSWVEKHLGTDIPVIAVSTAEKAVQGADIIVTCTTSMRPVLNGDHLSPGAHINAIGGFTPQMQEIDLRTVLRADKIVVDAAREAWACSGDLIVPLKSGAIDKDLPMEELGNIVEETSLGRNAEQEITLYESVGFAPLDLAVATAVYRQAVASG